MSGTAAMSVQREQEPTALGGSGVEHQSRAGMPNCLGSNIQWQSVVLKPSFMGEIVLNPELKSTNSILM